MAHIRRFVPASIGLVRGNIRHLYKTLFIQDKVEDFVISSNILAQAPFKWVGLMYRYGLINNLNTEFDKIDKKDGELPISIELRMDILQWADRHNIQLLQDIHMIGALEAMIHVCQKYKLPDDIFRAERAKFGNIPESIEECEELYAKQ